MPLPMTVLGVMALVLTMAPRSDEPRRFDPYAGPRPILVWIQEDPWAMVIGADTPIVSVYEDGTLICLERHEKGPATPVQRKLSPKDLDELVRGIRGLGTFSGLARFYDLAPGLTDLPTARFYLDLGGGPPVATGVYGLMTSNTALPAYTRLPTKRTADPLPDSLAALHKHLENFRCEGGAPWTPEYVEVMLWPYAYAPDKSIQWPRDWPGLDSPQAVPRGDGYSIYLAGSRLKELQDFLRTRSEKGAVEVGGKKWAAAYRHVFPSEPIWSRALRGK